MRIRRIVAAHAVSLALLAGAELSPEQYTGHVNYLASQELGGRGTGTKGLEKAADYIGRQFRAYGLQPATDRYFQQFPVTTHARLGERNALAILDGKERRTLKIHDEYLPLNFSASGRVAGQIVFAGYGITAPEYDYDDYAGLDVQKKVVVVLRREPQESDEKSVFAGRAYTRHAQLDSKAINARTRGASAVIVLTDLTSGKQGIEKFGRAAGPADCGIPVVQVQSEIGQTWFAKAGRDLREIREGIEKDLKPRSFALPEPLAAEIAVDVKRQVKMVRNVAGYLPGESSEYVVIGAHYDHLGLGEQFSLAPSMTGTAHLGADDNASGTAGVLELARYYASQPKRKRGILFVAFAGEELGLLGSGYYVMNPRFPMEKAVAMINMDMIGRIREGKVYVAGAGTGSTLKALIEEVQAKHPLQLDLSEQVAYGSSDHTSFTARQVPVLFFFSGLHEDYHKPSDTWDKIQAKEAVELLKLVSDVTDRLTDSAERPRFMKSQGSPGPAAGGGH